MTILGLHKLVFACQFYSTKIKVIVWFWNIDVLDSPSLNFNSFLKEEEEGFQFVKGGWSE